MRIVNNLRAAFHRLGKSGKTGAVRLELDVERSSISKYKTLTTSTATATSIIYSVPTGKRFQLQTLIISNHEVTSTNFRFYDSETTTTPVTPRIILDNNASLVLTEMQGLWFNSFVMVHPSQLTAANQAEVTIAGILDDED